MSLLPPQLEAFEAVARNQTVHGAARELGITQTGVTQRIRGLERDLGTTLFTRSRRGMATTPEGRALLQYCGSAREIEGVALARIQKSGEAHEVRVVLTGPSSLMASRIIPQVAALAPKFPALALTFQVNDIELRAEELRRGSAQLAILPREQVAREFDSKLLRPEQYVLVGSPRWKSRAVRDIVRTERIIDFDPTDRMSHTYLERYGLADLARSERHFVNHNQPLIHLLQHGLGYGVLTREVAREPIAQKRLIVLNGGAVLENRLALAWYPRPQPPAYFKAIIGAIH